MSKAFELARHLETLHINNMYKSDFYWTWGADSLLIQVGKKHSVS